MGTRGRTSAAALTVVRPGDVISTPRPKPPADLTEEQAAEWRFIVDGLPADWFPPETHQLLAQYCRHVVNARRLASLIEQTDPAADFGQYDKLLAAHEREGRAMSSLGTRMRITQQSTYSADKTKGKPLSLKPWQADEA